MKNMDLALLDELIKKCEAKMGSPFKKKSKEEPMGEEVAEKEDDEEPMALVVEKSEPMEGEEEDLSELLELYKKIKA